LQQETIALRKKIKASWSMQIVYHMVEACYDI